MESKFIPTLQVGNGYTYLKLRGVLDEDNLLANLISQIQGRLLLIDMAEMDRINSCGVRDWVNWLNQIQALGLQVILLRCSPAVVAQANMVTNFSADAFIHSFYAPYVHPDTGEEQSVLLFTEDLRQVRPIKAPKIFNDSGEELEFDEFEESYFAFVNDPRMLNYHVPADIDAVIQYFVPESASHQPVVTSKASASHDTPAPAPVQQPTSAAGPTAGPATMQGAFNAMQSPAANFGARIPSPAGMPQNNAFNTVSHPSGMYGNNVPANNSFGAANPGNAFPPPAQQMPQQTQQPASPLLPTPSAPVRHEQPPIPGNQGYQHLPTQDPVVRPAVQVQVQQPKPAAPNMPAPGIPGMPNGVPMPQIDVTDTSVTQPTTSPFAHGATPPMDMQPAAAHQPPANKNLLIIGVLIGIGVLIIIILIVIIVSKKFA